MSNIKGKAISDIAIALLCVPSGHHLSIQWAQLVYSWWDCAPLEGGRPPQTAGWEFRVYWDYLGFVC